MKFCFLVCFIFAVNSLMASTAEAEKAVDKGDFKQAIALYTYLLQTTSTENKVPITLELVRTYLRDQNQEMAFKTFLKLLEEKGCLKERGIENEKSKRAYEKALKIYFDKNRTPQEIAKKILQDFPPKEEDGSAALAYIQASAYANLNQYDKFFSLFCLAYQQQPDHFLADKTKAVLHMKLFERCPLNEERENHRKAILSFLSKAAETEPSDDSLYKFLILFAPEEKKSDILRTCLNKILQRNIVISRSDIAFYTKEAVNAKEFTLAQQFIDAARGWYQFSKIVNAAQQYLDNHKH